MMQVRVEDVLPGDRIAGDGGVVAVVFPGAPHNYATLVLQDHTLRHYRPQTLIGVERPGKAN